MKKNTPSSMNLAYHVVLLTKTMVVKRIRNTERYLVITNQ